MSSGTLPSGPTEQARLSAETRDFSYALRDVRVVFAAGAVSRLGEAVDSSVRASRLLVVSTPGRGPTTEAVRAALGGRAGPSFHGARLHVPVDVVREALDALRNSDADGVVAVGGGSAIGLGKALVKETGFPLVAVPTTYSGSEMTDIWGVTDGERKETGRDVRVAPRLVVYDPELTYALPPEVTGPSGMNAVAHAVEALYSEDGSPLASLLAADGIRRLARSLPVLTSDPGARPARWEALYGAHLCGRALDVASMGLHHKICHALGGSLDLPHALTHAVMLPYTVAYNASSAPRAVAATAASLEVDDAPRGLWELNRRLGITGSLADLGVKPDDLDRVVGQVTSRSYPNPAPVTEGGVRRLLERAMMGEAPG